MKLRRLALAAALTLGVGVAVPVAVGTSPAWALNCTFGDAFYQFVATYTADAQAIDSSSGFLFDNAGAGGGDLFCQVYQPGFGSGWYEWVKKGTADCLTINASRAYQLDMVACHPGWTSQEWAFLDPLGNETYGQWESDYTNSGYRSVFMADPAAYDQGLQGWNPNDVGWEWGLNGPFR